VPVPRSRTLSPLLIVAKPLSRTASVPKAKLIWVLYNPKALVLKVVYPLMLS